MNLTTLNPNFLKNAKKLIDDVAKNKPAKEKITAYNFDDKRIKESYTALQDAEKADQAFLAASGETSADQEKFFSIFKEAYLHVTRHLDFLNLVMENGVEKSFVFVFGTYLLSREMNDYFSSAKEIYIKLLTDSQIQEKLEQYGILEIEFDEGLRLNLEASKAYHKKYIADKRIENAVTQKNTAFNKLFMIVQELTIICQYSLLDNLDMKDKLGSIPSSIKLMMNPMAKDSSITLTAEKDTMVKDSSIT